jgi:hypothetical protein
MSTDLIVARVDKARLQLAEAHDAQEPATRRGGVANHDLTLFSPQ